MNKRKVAVGPGASSMILIAVVLTMCVLAVLTMISARNDDGLSIRSEETTWQVYTLSGNGEKTLAVLDSVLVRCRKDTADEEAYLAAVEKNLPGGMYMEGDQVFWKEILNDHTLECGVRLLPADQEDRFEWTVHRVMVSNGSDGREDEWD